MSFEIVDRNGIKTVQYASIPVPHGHSTRPGGVSSGPYASLNLSISTGDDLTRVEENRRLLGRAVGLEVIPRLKMVHGVEVAVISISSHSKGLPEADACVSDEPGVSLSITTADCVPLIFYCPKVQAVGLAHAGWRGTVDGIARQTALALKEHYGCSVEQLRVAIGPCIGRCCFMVGPEVAAEFAACYGSEEVVSARRGRVVDKFEVDLREANRIWLRRAGVLDTNISSCDLCTSCHEDLFFSHRRDRGLTGRMMTVIQRA